MAADPGCRAVRLQKGEVAEPWLYQESSICAIHLLLLKIQILCTSCSSCAAQSELQMLVVATSSRRSQAVLPSVLQ